MPPLAQPSAYDVVEYPSEPITECQPIRMASIAALAGLTPPPFLNGTVVDLGCGTAANLLSIASAYPGVTAIGVDPSAAAIALGQRLVDDAGLDNVTLVADSRTPLKDGLADFVVVHGVLSWVDPDTRDRVIAEAARIARPGGLVLLSYDADPGSLTVLVSRSIGRRTATAQLDAGDAPGAHAALLDRLDLASVGAAAGGLYRRVVTTQRAHIADRDPQALFHDELGENWSPIAVADLAAQSSAHGLGYVGELRAADRWRAAIAPHDLDALTATVGPSAADQQQYVDDLTGSAFHDSLFVKGTAPLLPECAGAAAPPGACPAADWHVRSTQREWHEDPDRDRIAVLETALDAGDRGLSVGELAHRTGLEPAAVLALASVLDMQHLVTLALGAAPAATEPGNLPFVPALARAQVRAGHERVTSLRHGNVALVDAPLRLLLPLLDGTHNRAALTAALSASEILLEHVDPAELLDECLTALCRSGLLRGPQEA